MLVWCGFVVILWDFFVVYLHSGKSLQKTMESNIFFKGKLTHFLWRFSIAMLDYQMIYLQRASIKHSQPGYQVVLSQLGYRKRLWRFFRVLDLVQAFEAQNGPKIHRFSTSKSSAPNESINGSVKPETLRFGSSYLDDRLSDFHPHAGWRVWVDLKRAFFSSSDIPNRFFKVTSDSDHI